MKADDKLLAALLAKTIAALCVRNTFLEDLHAGVTPSSQSGDNTDVKVVTPYGDFDVPLHFRVQLAAQGRQDSGSGCGRLRHSARWSPSWPSTPRSTHRAARSLAASAAAHSTAVG